MVRQILSLWFRYMYLKMKTPLNTMNLSVLDVALCDLLYVLVNLTIILQF